MAPEQQRGVVHIVDDDEEIRESLLLLIEAEGIPVIAYETAQNFLDAYTPGSTGCLVVDIRMPGMSGIELFNVLQQKNTPLPVIFMTGHGDEQMADNAMKAGVHGFLIKPFDIEKLIQLVQECLKKSEELIKNNPT